jgi:D-amino-acid dehydrogenase
VHEDLAELLRDLSLEHMMTKEGCLSLYADEAEFKADRDHIEILDRFGFDYHVLERDAIAELEPALSKRIGKAVLFPENRSISDPYKLVLGIAERFKDLGGEFVQGEVVDFELSGTSLTGVRLMDGRVLLADEVVLAAGAYTSRLSTLLKEPIPLETERGYHTQVMAPGVRIRHSVIWPAKAFMVTPTAGGIRIGGTVEMAGLDAAPNYSRAKVLLKRAKEALPELQALSTTEWMGHRPALPDTVPVMGRSAKFQNLWYASGHGHLGLTYAATNARLISDLILGIKPPIDMSPYRVNRF